MPRGRTREGATSSSSSASDSGKNARRGRPSRKGTAPARPAEVPIRVTCIKLPVTDRDEETVECKLCGHKCTFREFRIHNMQKHSNIGTTTDDPTVPEHKFYERRLKELAKFTKIKTFQCPTQDCGVSYKSTLGLAYHLETCGKTKEEIEMCLIQCDQCDQKLTLPNMFWHKKRQHSQPGPSDASDDVDDNGCIRSLNSVDEVKQLTTMSTGKRKSAIKARQGIKNATDDLADETEKISISEKRSKKNEEWVNTGRAYDIEFENDESEVEFKSKPYTRYNNTGRYFTASGKSDFNMNATKFINSRAPQDSYWEAPKRIKLDPFSDICDNQWEDVSQPEKFLKDYLPNQKESVAFKTEVETTPADTIIKEYRKLPWFTGEVIDDYQGNLVFNVGGPVFGISWHPNGKFLAVSTGSEPTYNVDYKKTKKQKASIQIYSHHFENPEGNNKKERKPILNCLTLQLIICLDYGFVTNLQWGSFWPDCLDNFSVEKGTFEEKYSKTDRLGYIACSCEDGSIRICSLRTSDLTMKNNFSLDKLSKTRVYKKVPEMCLKVDNTIYANTGQVCRFDWHEMNRFLIAGYSSGIVAIYDLETNSKLLRNIVKEDDKKVVLLSPFWVFQAHVGPVTGVHFDPSCPRYFTTASKDRYLKIWDMDLRKETECRKVGLVVETCWIRGWIHVAVAVDASISNLSSQYNYVRFYQIGHSQGRPNVAEFMDISSLSFYNGITIQATENGTVTSTYFDHFWRECDFDRNKKKHNIVNICKVSLDKTSFKPIDETEFPQTDKNYAPFTFKQEEPRINLVFCKERLRSQAIKEPNIQYFEDYARFFPFIRINKVSWCPLGKYFAVGYRSGLLTIVPASFQSLYG